VLGLRVCIPHEQRGFVGQAHALRPGPRGRCGVGLLHAPEKEQQRADNTERQR
jgi:hypothetical protein